MKIKRRDLLAAGASVTAASIAMPAIAQTSPDMQWRMTSSFP
jgi:TRAP-type mannitol/chloroaromatic compound transport system substrate-binding protein